MLDAVVAYLPSPLDVGAIDGHPVGNLDEVVVARARRGRAARLARVQDRERPAPRQAHVRPHLLRHDDGRLPGAQQHQGQQGADRQDLPDAREQARGDRARRRGPDRRGHGPQEHHDRRHAVRAGRPDHPGVDELPGAGHLASPSSRRPRATRRSSASRSSGSPRRTRRSRSARTRTPARRSSRAWASCTSTCWSTACAASSRSRRTSASRRWPTARPSAARWRSTRYVAQEADRWVRPVRQGPDRPRADRWRGRRRLRVREQRHRRPDPEGVHPVGRRGLPGRDGVRRARRLPAGGRQGDASATARTTTSTRPSSRSRSPARWRSRRPPARPTRSCSSRSWRSRSGRPTTTWAR